MRKSIAIIACLLISGCSSTTAIRASDPEARIYVNDEYVGTGTAWYTDRKPAFTKQRVTLRKDGCGEQEYHFRRNEEPDTGAIIGGLLLTVPFLWVTEYKDEHAYEFHCQPM